MAVAAAVADKSVAVEAFGPFAELVLEPELELVSFSKSDIAVVHTFVAAECKFAVAACSWDCQKSFAVDELQQSL